MQKLQLLCVGKLKESFYLDACREYQKRLLSHCKLSIIEIAEAHVPEVPSPAQVDAALRKEAATIEQKIQKNAVLVALCVEGQMLSSEDLSKRMTTWMTKGVSSLAFVIGGSHGLHPAIKERADLCLSMSRMTFPHHLARVMVLEQVYRAFQINKGTKYHK